MTANMLCYGDNLKVLRDHVPDESGDRVRTDVPDRSIAPARDAQQEENDDVQGDSRGAADINTLSWCGSM